MSRAEANHRKIVDRVGQRFGLLVVLRLGESTRDGKSTWLCRCDCGTTPVVRGEQLQSGRTQSCGCLRAGNGLIHGLSRSPTYSSWLAMRSRCSNPNDTAYDDYGGRGIKVCDRWQSSFENFLADMGQRPENPPGWRGARGYWTIDRIDVDGNYEPGNCRWATPSEQERNKRRHKAGAL